VGVVVVVVVVGVVVAGAAVAGAAVAGAAVAGALVDVLVAVVVEGPAGETVEFPAASPVVE